MSSDSDCDITDNESNKSTPKGSAAKKKKYGQCYKESWESIPDFKGWLAKSGKGTEYALCKPCRKDINIISGKNALDKHNSSKNHEKNVNSILKQKTLDTFRTAGPSIQKKMENDIKEGNLFLD